MNSHTFSIENEINPNTKQPFGNKYAGTFTIRRPSLADKNTADIKKAAMLAAYGTVNPAMLSEWTKSSTYIFSLVTTIATDKLPEWFDLGKVFDESDEDAFMAVWAEVGKFQDTFRHQTAR